MDWPTCIRLGRAAGGRKLSTAALPTYRVIYFNSRGAAEPIRLLLAISGAPWHDLRYPMGAGVGGFTLDERYVQDRDGGAYAVSMDKLPVCQVCEREGAVQTIGQSHAIARYIARRHGMLGSTVLEEAAVDGLYECVRDIRSSWFKVKAERIEADAASSSGGARLAAKHGWWASELPEACRRLEAAVEFAPRTRKNARPAPWLVGDAPSLADVAVYHLLSASTSPTTGSTVSFFDGEAERVRAAYIDACPRLAGSVAAVGAMRAVREWEQARPDTFS
jgi:glutathione S-transferase